MLIWEPIYGREYDIKIFYVHFSEQCIVFVLFTLQLDATSDSGPGKREKNESIVSL